MRFLLGGYTPDMDGRASGIGMLVAGEPDSSLAGGPLSFQGTVAEADSPSWVAAHPSLDVVYAAIEKTGAVQAYRRTGEASFTAFGDAVNAGEATCHVAVAPDGSSLIASCWGDGRVVHIDVDSAGTPRASALGAAAADPYAGFEERVSRAHSARFLPDGRIATADLGFDLIRFWRGSRDGLVLDHEVVLPRGSGPRHMVLHPSGHLHVVTEYSCEVFTLAEGRDGRWAVIGGTPLGGLPGDAAAELARSRDGEYLYAGLRGSNTIAVLRVRDGGDRTEAVALVDSGVNWPRHHLVVRDTLLVGGQLSDEVVSLSLDIRTGVPGRPRHRVEAPSVTCLLPVSAA
ncbi:beta-propeller fold lactonase family protein [Microbacterium sp. C7(2022)]|uniref:lactonase family protein n=1 Tax=Microbacterium sp. C7(2022) TaxID=2992759 RepID=UPI00237BA875|nr:beta-propeller fold lactonase family protein [Microbacterium sp. C7(2022)]MDE0545051.1 lactonase family protein [Microbacterium sp. C7(2022)]